MKPDRNKIEKMLKEAIDLLKKACIHVTPSDMIDDQDEVDELNKRIEDFISEYKRSYGKRIK